MAIYRKVYYDKGSGIVLHHETSNFETDADIVRDYQTIKDLNVRFFNTIGLVEYYNDDLDEDFKLCGGNVKIDLVTLKPVFSYPTNNGGGSITTEKNIVEQLQDLKDENKSLNSSVIELFEIIFG